MTSKPALPCCSVPGCDKPAAYIGHTVCSTHYQAIRRAAIRDGIPIRCKSPNCNQPAYHYGLCPKHIALAREQQPKTICAYEGCNREVLAKGLCKNHYHSRLLKAQRRCIVPGCDLPSLRQHLCSHHYYMARAARRCAVPDCHKAIQTRGLCEKHYRQRLANDQSRPRCTVPGCDNIARGHGLCEKHYRQRRKTNETRAAIAHAALAITARMKGPA